MLGHLQQKKFGKQYPSEIFPEIYLIKVNNFDDVSKTPLDEWMYFLKNSALPENYTAKGLKQVEEKLNYEKMNTAEKKEYDNFIKSARISKSAIESAQYVAKEKGIEEGIQKGIEKARTKAVLKGYDNHLPISLISNINDLSEEEVIKILKDHAKMI